MKILLLIVFVFVAGCQTTTPPLLLPKPIPEPRPIATTPTTPPAPPTTALERNIRQQAQLIEALVSQNDALTAKLADYAATHSEPFPTPAPNVALTAALEPSPTPLLDWSPPALLDRSPPAPLESPPLTPLEPAPTAPLEQALSAPPEPTPTMSPPAPVLPPPPAPVVESFLVPNADGVIDLVAVSAAASQSEPANPFAVRSVPAEAMREVTLRVGGIITGTTPCAVINERLVEPGDSVESLGVERIESDAVLLRRGEHRLRLPVAEKPTRVRLVL